jgi:hypothetical protein
MEAPTSRHAATALARFASGLACFALTACGGGVVVKVGNAGADAGAADGAPATTVSGTVTAPDCPGCTFPAMGAASCPAPSVKIVYPADGALLPPNLGVLSVQWVPHGSPFTRFEVDFAQSAQAPYTDWRIVTSCAASTTDTTGASTNGCELAIDPTSWSQLVAANRGGSPVAITVRGTTDGTCASTSTDTIRVSFAEQDVPGSYLYWKSAVSPLGTGGGIWRKTFGSPSTAEQKVTGGPLGGALCAGCHFVARDGSRMVAYAIDDTDPDYGGLAGTYFDTTALPSAAAVVAGNTGTSGSPGEPPGWTAISPSDGTYATSNGVPCLAAASLTGPPCGATLGYPGAVGITSFALWKKSGTFDGPLQLTASGNRPTMPDWSTDGASLVYVVPKTVGSWDNGARTDDDHVFGGSLYSVTFSETAGAGAPLAVVSSQGENNYYPAFSPDSPSSLVLFDRAPLDPTVSTLTGCKGTPPLAQCPNDSFSNPAARMMLVHATQGSAPVDLQHANGSSTSLALAFSNSYPRWVPVVQSYKGKTLMWITFSSTRDYGLRLTNQRNDLHPCYPGDSLEWPGSTHHAVISTTECQQPQIWMAPVLLDARGLAVGTDPSGVAFWIPYQDPTTHAHMATWSR